MTGAAGGLPWLYLGRVFLHGLEVEEGDVDQVIAMDDGDQLPLHVVAFPEAQQISYLGVLRHTRDPNFYFSVQAEVCGLCMFSPS